MENNELIDFETLSLYGNSITTSLLSEIVIVLRNGENISLKSKDKNIITIVDGYLYVSNMNFKIEFDCVLDAYVNYTKDYNEILDVIGFRNIVVDTN